MTLIPVPGPGPSPVRKQPLQDRAMRTVDAIFQATAQLVAKEGTALLTTHKIAARAGFSVGTLYQYFSSKEAIFRAMSEASREQVLRELDRFLNTVEAQPNVRQLDPREWIRQWVRINLESLAWGDGIRRSMIRLCWLMEQPEESSAMARLAAQRMALCLQRMAHPAFREPTGARLFALTRSVLGCLRSASIEESPLLQGQELEDVLVDMAAAALLKP